MLFQPDPLNGATGGAEAVEMLEGPVPSRHGRGGGGAAQDLGASAPAGTLPPAARLVTRWERRYVRATVVVDLAAITLSVVAGLWVGYAISVGDERAVLTLAVVTTIGMSCAFRASGAWDPRVLGQGSEEFNRLIRAVVSSLVVLSLVGLALDTPGIRPWVFIVLPVAGLLAALGRYLLRRPLHALRRQHRCMHPVLAVGSDEAIAELVDRTRRDVHQGWLVAGACTPGGTASDSSREIAGVPVVGDLDGLAVTVLGGGYRVVAIAPSAGWSPRRLQQLAWDLEGTGVELVVQPGLMEIAGPRLHVTPVDGLPLLRLTEPVFTGIPLLIKAVADRIFALVLLVLIAPVLLAITIAVRLDGGPAFYRQVRIGRNGRPFRMVKFRSMEVDADRRRPELLSANDGAGPLFKLRADPRVTRVGRALRRYSLDELPQLFNVLSGSMSLVGPRPPLPDEVATYSRAAMRKFLVRPGLTGLWQISGRSDLSWEESVRLDLRYVENWNPALDLQILWRTLGAVLRGHGAY